jgi:hypothetical protein
MKIVFWNPFFVESCGQKEGGVMDLDFQIANTYSLNVCNWQRTIYVLMYNWISYLACVVFFFFTNVWSTPQKEDKKKIKNVTHIFCLPKSILLIDYLCKRCL